ncbi:putative bifunctional diguanylate cyclase/phosphodiesterase [Paracraurococcus lichenis]|uniref:Sensor domain-containing phosphodiesterase n=1 Tax=Paracraurococcus lichenis TaxID=3064888 RepID=A0ABT9DVV4_9PROT|nr:sensor domain-containing phosphodiesterase [Paracraurococcus sp. LOR1-02]MDO9708036.1 sensor domain-containing phosphodiesterase [Paracraurococcus sp. LOR1-02]
MIDERTEAARLDALRMLDLLDTPPSESFDRITRMAAQLFRLPIAAVSLTDFDRQWFKSRVGVSHTGLPREKAPCALVAESRDCLVVPDLLTDARYHDSPLAGSGARFYAGAPLLTREGFGLGAMCVVGPEPRAATPEEMAALADLAAMVMAQIELQHAFGRVDPLSGMPNRIQFLEDLEDMARDRPPGEPRIAVLIDLASPERLSAAVRVMGSVYLDDMIRLAGRILRAAMPAGCKAYHVAATQFAFVAPPDLAEPGCTVAMRRMLDRLAEVASPHLMAGLAAGLAPFRLGETAPRDVLRTAHGAAQDARGSEGRIGIHSSAQDAAHRRRFGLLQDFAQALERPDELRLVFQPRIDLASGACRGGEALLRWRHPALGEVSPGEFMPLVEQTSMARPATAWVLEAAMRQLAAWREAGLDLQLSVNVSAANLAERDLPGRVLDGLRRHRLSPDCLELEVTESTVMEDAGQALAVLEALAGAGIRLAIDDFGTGHSSLSYLQRLPAQVVKIDQSFMRGLMSDDRKQALVSTMILLSHDLGYEVVAEGVEDAEVRDFLVAASCNEAQGYLFARPMAAGDFLAWRQAHADGEADRHRQARQPRLAVPGERRPGRAVQAGSPVG